MILSDVVAIALSIIGFLLSLQGLWLLCRALWPNRVERSAGRCERNGVACFFVGLLVSAAIFLVAAVGGKRLGAPGQLAAFILLFVFIIISGVGTAGFVTHIGRRLESPADAGRPWRATIRGGVALELACLIPVLGWFGILPISLIVGAGAATLSLFDRPARRAARASLIPAIPSEMPARRPPTAAMPLPALEGQGVL
ncbi:MAG TPA: hypothetical protein VFE47_25060 [Tepidisphaeraceae bacterium]|jgi:hypothetical protein|nr:hypothetical protein [Tepidisphaeraceae bacterium]